MHKFVGGIVFTSKMFPSQECLKAIITGTNKQQLKEKLVIEMLRHIWQRKYEINIESDCWIWLGWVGFLQGKSSSNEPLFWRGFDYIV